MRTIKFLQDITIVGVFNLELVEEGVIPRREVEVTFKKNTSYDMHEWLQPGNVTSLTTDDKALMGNTAVEGDTLTFPGVPLLAIEGCPSGYVEKVVVIEKPKVTFALPSIGSNPLLEDSLDEENEPVLS